MYTSYGVLCWLNDIDGWARIVSRYLKAGGTFFIAEFHPFAGVFDEDSKSELRVKYRYWHHNEPDHFFSPYTYDAGDATVENEETFEWSHPISSVINALINEGLTIHEVKEYPYSVYEQLKFSVKLEDSYWHIPRDSIPLMYSIKASKTKV